MYIYDKGGEYVITIYLDFDNTIVESNKKVIDILNNRYNCNKTENDLKDYGFNSIHKISEEEKLSIFDSDEFFTNLQFKPHIIETITKYFDKFKWVIITKGTPTNLEKKFAWLDENWPFQMERVGITNGNLSKAVVNMSDGIQIDDVTAALDTKAAVRILYKDYNNFCWQQLEPGDDIVVVNSWEEIDSILEFYSKFDIRTLEKRR